ncbi:MAG TPA: 50S ribosome-binding GTPase, partial [Anaerolineaceae bacterium]|nr:50S ribosome-binding GTPase [Anaerolineaceae bacterium]
MDENFRSGFVALIGRPNVGKSTLLNALLGQKIAAVSPRPQTTRRRQMGILTLENAQVVFMDTPGIHKPQHKLGEYMNDVALLSIPDADVILWLVDASVSPHPEDLLIADKLNASPPAGWVALVLNKCDLLGK